MANKKGYKPSAETIAKMIASRKRNALDKQRVKRNAELKQHNEETGTEHVPFSTVKKRHRLDIVPPGYTPEYRTNPIEPDIDVELLEAMARVYLLMQKRK